MNFLITEFKLNTLNPLLNIGFLKKICISDTAILVKNLINVLMNNGEYHTSCLLDFAFLRHLS